MMTTIREVERNMELNNHISEINSTLEFLKSDSLYKFNEAVSVEKITIKDLTESLNEVTVEYYNRKDLEDKTVKLSVPKVSLVKDNIAKRILNKIVIEESLVAKIDQFDDADYSLGVS